MPLLGKGVLVISGLNEKIFVTSSAYAPTTTNSGAPLTVISANVFTLISNVSNICPGTNSSGA